MKKIVIYEPAMCCSTGLCGVGVDPELLRISTVMDKLAKQAVQALRYNLSSAPMEFVTNIKVNGEMEKHGVEVLPIIVLDDEIVLTGRYPSNEELTAWLELAPEVLGN